MKILVSGATGFIGRRLVELLAPDHEVIGLSRSPGASPRSIAMDLSVGIDASRLPPRVDAVVHLAQSEHYREFPERAGHIYAVNVDSTFRLLEYARHAQARRFVLASSGGIYGYASEPLVESRAPQPPDFYLRTKHMAEVLLFSYAAYFAAIAVRPFFVYGAGQRTTMFIPRLARNVLAGRPITLSPPDGLDVNPIHVTDAARGFREALTADFAGPVNLAGRDVLTLGEVARLMGRQLDREPVLEHVASDQGNVVGDLALMTRVLGLPRIRFEDGVVEVCQEASAELARKGA